MVILFNRIQNRVGGADNPTVSRILYTAPRRSAVGLNQTSSRGLGWILYGTVFDSSKSEIATEGLRWIAEFNAIEADTRGAISDRRLAVARPRARSR